MNTLTKQRFDALMGSTRGPWTHIAGIEREWYSEQDEKVLCVIVEDTTDSDFTCIVLGRDRIGRYRAVDVTKFFDTITAARAVVPGLLADWASRDAQEYEQGDESRQQMDFFTPRHPIERLNPTFATLVRNEEFSPARGIVESLMFYFEDPDGNFVEQFQSTAFNARIWELYLFAVLAEDRCVIDRTHPAPDYLYTGIFGEAFLEAVTVNPNEAGEPGYPQDGEALQDYKRNYLPIKFSGPLTSKLNKRYWEKPYINNRPIILAIADFHQPSSMGRSQDALLSYLYGQRFERQYDDKGRLTIHTEPLTGHEWHGKKVPSGFFNLPDAENISAIISTGEETILKFSRMGLRAGFGSKRVQMTVSGWRCVEHPTRVPPERFELNARSPKYEEFWIDGLQVYHNPRANKRLDIRMFGDATHHRWRNGRLDSVYVDHSPFGVETRITIADDGTMTTGGPGK